MIVVSDSSPLIAFAAERKGRSVATGLGLRVTGVVGALVQAKRRGMLDRVTPVLDALDLAGFRLGRDVRERALELAGEDLPR